MDKLDNAKILMIRQAIRMDKRITKDKLIPGITDGLIKDIAKYVRKNNKMPSVEDIMERYSSNDYFVETIGMVGIKIEEMNDITSELLGFNINKYENVLPSPVATEKIGRNDACPCGSSKKYKKCCGK